MPTPRRSAPTPTQPHLKTLPPSLAVWLATVAHIRHAHTEYDKLSMRKAMTAIRRASSSSTQTNEVLTRWRATRLLDADEEETYEAYA